MPRHNKKSSSKATIPATLLLKLANECTNPLKLLPDFEPSELLLLKNAPNHDLLIKFFKWSDLPTDVQQWMIDLTEQNMKDLYDSCSWGWNRQSKIGEFKNTTARHLIVYDKVSPDTPIAFVHFRFEEGYSSDATLYCYELQVMENYRRKGIGKCLMDLLVSLASYHRMKKVLLTVLKSNTDAFEFYSKALGFKIDKDSPSTCGQQAVYEILSKKSDLSLSKTANV